MTKKERELLYIDLCARLLYGVRADGYPWATAELVYGIDHDSVNIQGSWVNIENVKPYLRSMSSMTEEEEKEYHEARSDYYDNLETYDWLNAHHFDYRGLIEKGLALEAPEGMYKTI